MREDVKKKGGGVSHHSGETWCPVCMRGMEGKLNCCNVGGSWAGKCHGLNDWNDGFDLCNPPRPPPEAERTPGSDR